jgi:hypothetical protein
MYALFLKSSINAVLGLQLVGRMGATQVDEEPEGEPVVPDEPEIAPAQEGSERDG